MRLSLVFPPTPLWDVKQAPNNQFAAILPGGPDGKPDAVITFGPIMMKPDEPRPWMELVARSDSPRGSKVQLGRTIDLTTSAGWPLRLLEAEVLTANNEVIEVRLCAFFTFMEHASVAIVRAANRTRLDANGKAILAILETGRPDWSGDPVCLADVWDLEPRQQVKPRPAPRANPVRNDDALATALAQVDAALAAGPTAQDHVRRGGVLLELQRPAESLASFEAAIALDATLEAAHYFTGVALGDLGRHPEAIAAWERALALSPDRIDTHYNVAQARFLVKDFSGALAGFQRVAALDPSDFMTLRKVAQCFYALGRHDDGQVARVAFRQRWATTPDPRARFITEYVFDQFDGDGFSVHAVETLRPSNPSMYAVLTFRAIDLHDHALPATVLVETSDQARAAGTPFVVGVTAGRQFRVVGTANELPPYAELKQDIVKLLREAIASLKPA